MIEARGRIPADGAFRVALGEPQPEWSDLTATVRRDVRPLLPPPPAGRPRRRVDPLSRLRPCRVPCGRCGLGGRGGPLAPAGRAMTLRAIGGLVVLNAGFAGGGALVPLRGARPPALAGRPPARRSRLPPRCRRLRRPLDAAAGRRRRVQRLGDRPHARRRHARRRRRGSGAGPPAAPVAAEHARVDAHPSRHRGWRRARRSPARGALPRGTAAEPAGLRRLGVLGSEGEGPLLLRRARRAGVHDLGRADLPAARADPRRGRLPRHGERGRRHVPPPVLVPAPRRRRRARRLSVPAGPRLAPLAVAPRRPRRTALRGAPAHPAGGHARRRALRRRRGASRAVARGRPWLASRRRRRAPRGRDADEARGSPVRRDRPGSRLRGLVARATAGLGSARRASGSSSSRRPSPGGCGTARRT